jgi:hypothetical protein
MFEKLIELLEEYESEKKVLKEKFFKKLEEEFKILESLVPSTAIVAVNKPYEKVPDQEKGTNINTAV